MVILYNFSLFLYYLAIYIAQFFNPKAKKWILGRQNFWNNLPNVSSNEVFWFHCASLGEFDQGLPLMNKLKEKNPSIFLLVTFFSPSGFENYNKRQHLVDFACYIPLDTTKNAQKFINHFKPKQCFFVKYEFWYSYINEAKKSGAKVYSICTIFRDDHRFFKWYGGFFRKSLRLIDYFFVQNQSSIDLLKGIQITKASVVGDMRFDRVIENKNKCTSDVIITEFLKDQKAFIIGSSWSVDEGFLCEFILSYSKLNKIIIAPHDIKEKHILEIEQRFKGETCRYSKFDTSKNEKNILIVDCIGKLSNIYQYGSLAYIGGGFTGSLHNILEPAVFGLPVIFGPKHKRFPEAQMFIENGVGFSISEKSQIESTIQNIKKNDSILKQKLDVLIKNQAGVVDEIYTFLKK
jgi:3-deoxy-D-manno-octulosonic-acid transferase